MLDDTDRKLLDLLQCNAHMSNADMAAQVGPDVDQAGNPALRLGAAGSSFRGS